MGCEGAVAAELIHAEAQLLMLAASNAGVQRVLRVLRSRSALTGRRLFVRPTWMVARRDLMALVGLVGAGSTTVAGEGTGVPRPTRHLSDSDSSVEGDDGHWEDEGEGTGEGAEEGAGEGAGEGGDGVGNVDARDSHGATALRWAAKHLDRGTLMVLLSYGASADACCDGWNVVQELILAGCSAHLLADVLTFHRAQMQHLWGRKLPSMLCALDARGGGAPPPVGVEAGAAVPAFYVEIKWHFQSTVAPLVGYVLPSDTIRVWKSQRRLRADWKFRALDGLSKIKQQQSFLFDGGGEGEGEGGDEGRGGLVAWHGVRMGLAEHPLKANAAPSRGQSKGRQVLDLMDDLFCTERVTRKDAAEILKEDVVRKADVNVSNVRLCPALSWLGYERGEERVGSGQVRWRGGRVVKDGVPALPRVVRGVRVEHAARFSSRDAASGYPNGTVLERRARSVLKPTVWLSRNYPLSYRRDVAVVMELLCRPENLPDLRPFHECCEAILAAGAGADAGAVAAEPAAFPVKATIPVGNTFELHVTFEACVVPDEAPATARAWEDVGVSVPDASHMCRGNLFAFPDDYALFRVARDGAGDDGGDSQGRGDSDDDGMPLLY